MKPRRDIQVNAKRFLVFREGAAINWDCTYAELAKGTGIPVSTLHSICTAAGWVKRGWFPKASSRAKHGQIEDQIHLPVDTAMNMSESSAPLNPYGH